MFKCPACNQRTFSIFQIGLGSAWKVTCSNCGTQFRAQRRLSNLLIVLPFVAIVPLEIHLRSSSMAWSMTRVLICGAVSFALALWLTRLEKLNPPNQGDART